MAYKKNKYFEERDYDFYNPKPELMRMYSLLIDQEKNKLWAYLSDTRYAYIDRKDISNISLAGLDAFSHMYNERDDYGRIRNEMYDILSSRRDPETD